MGQVFQGHPMIESSAGQQIARSRCSASRQLLVISLMLAGLAAGARGLLCAQSASTSAGISKGAAQSCEAKIKRMESFSTTAPAGKKQTVQLSDTELNSYLALVLSPNYHPSLKSIRLRFEASKLQGIATVDFDRLEFTSTQILSGLLRRMMTGIHTLTVAGELVTGSGRASFKLDEARFDSLTLPNMLVAEILSAVGRKQNPPIDPMQPSELPYDIDRVDTRPGYIVIYQQRAE